MLDPYHRRVVAGCQRYPFLQNLADFLGDNSSLRPKPCRIACLEFSSANKRPVRRQLDNNGLATLLQSPYTKTDDILGRILVVEDLDADVIKMVRSSLMVDPSFFAYHLHTSRAEITGRKSYPPADIGKSDYLHVRYLRPFDFGKMVLNGKLLTNGTVRRKAVATTTTQTCVGFVQGCFSTLIRIEQGEVWLC